MDNKEMVILKDIKKEFALQISKIIPVKLQKGLCTGMRLYGNLFYNRRPNDLNDEEGFYEQLNLKDKVIIEAGAHIGIYTMFFASKIQNGKILAFEPNPISFYFLTKNLRVNSLLNAITQNAGLSNKKGKLHFVSKRYNMAKGTFKIDKQEMMKKEHTLLVSKEVSVTTIDEVVAIYSLDGVDFIKIDTEGFEPYVIEGMENTLKRFSPVIYFELHGMSPQQKQNDLKRIFNFLKRHAYSITNLVKGLPDVHEHSNNENCGGGYVAYRDKLALNIEKALMHWTL